MENKNEEEKVNIRHTINAEETFTLAKDVYDIRSLIKNIYSNRAVIARRLNILTFSVSFAFTLLYVIYIIATGLMKNMSLGSEIAIYCLFGAYGAMFITLIILTLCMASAKAKNVKKFKIILSYFRLAVRLLSVAITIVALVFATLGGEYSANHIAIDIILIIFSIICLVIQLIPLLFGGFGKLARWLLSPVKIKHHFSTVALEWYELAVTSSGESKTTQKVSQKYFDEIGICLDNFLIPALGKKYVSTIKPATILGVVDQAAQEDKAIIEGILKSVFAYAEECGYVTFNPCRDLNFQGSVDEEEKPKKTIKSRLFGWGKKVGMNLLDKYIEKSTDTEDK